jgi:hypothetical protein
MAILTSETEFVIQEVAPVLSDEYDMLLLPENTGTDSLRELHYPDDFFPPIIYEDMPDKWEHFDSEPLTARPIYKAEMTLAATMMTVWDGFMADRPVREIWSGDQSKSRASVYFLRRLWEYFVNPPASGYITWHPKDRTTKAFNVIIENLSVGGTDLVVFDYNAVYRSYLLGEVILTLRIVSEVEA